MTNEDWNYVRDNVRLFNYVELLCDGHSVSLKEERLRNKIVIAVYVDGFIKGSWLSHDCDIRRKFMRPVTKYAYSKKFRDDMLKIFGKRQYNKNRGKYEAKRTYYLPYWHNINSLIRHLQNNCNSIELINKPNA